MIKQEVTITNRAGLQVEEAGVLCDAAMSFRSGIRFFYRGGSEANAKSVLSILGACIKSGETVELCIDGEDEEEAMETILRLIENHFEK